MKEILETGKCQCIYEPRGDYGLEGFQLNDIYSYEKQKSIKNGIYYKILLNDQLSPLYGEYCKQKAFNKCFKVIK